MDDIVDRIRKICKDQGTSITKLESKLGYANGTIGKWKSAKRNPPLEKVISISHEIGVSAEYLLTGEKEKPAGQMADGQSEDAILFEAYKAAPENVQEAIRNLLGLK